MALILETERLVLRAWSEADAKDLFEICRDPLVMLHIGNREPYQNPEEAETFLRWTVEYQKENGFCRWAVVEKSSQKIVGSCGLARRETKEVELGYLFGREFWGKGYATEAGRAALQYGFDKLHLTKIIALTDLDHTASQRVLEKIGFRRGGIEKNGEEEALVFEISRSG